MLMLVLPCWINGRPDDLGTRMTSVVDDLGRAHARECTTNLSSEGGVFDGTNGDWEV